MKLDWQQAPVKTEWGDEMVVASVEIDKDHTLSLYCEQDQVEKVDALLNKEWVGLTIAEVVECRALGDAAELGYAHRIGIKLKEKNGY